MDVFFVLSGFLITSIILSDLRENKFSMREFYLRRIQRLLPNVILTVLAVVILWAVFMPPSAARLAAHHGLWAIFDLSNFYCWTSLGGYWGTSAEHSPLTHTWSLGIEEQFYLVFPGSLLLLARWQPRKMRVWLIIATGLSFALCWYGTGTHAQATFYLLPTRFWELTIGATLASFRIPVSKDEDRKRLSFGLKTQEAIGVAGIGMVLLGYFLIDGDSAFPGVVSLLPTLGSGLVLISIVEQKTRLSRMLSYMPLVIIGELSYSIYLWHWPLITFGKSMAIFYGQPQIYGSIVGGIVGVLLAWVAYVCVEQPLRRRGPGRPWRLSAIASGLALATVCCVVVAARKPVADPYHRFNTPSYSGEAYTAGNADIAKNASQSISYYDVYFTPIPSNRPKDFWRTGGVVHLYGGGHPQIVVLGSSHALMYSRLIDDICREKGISVAFLGAEEGTPAFFSSTPNDNFSTVAEAREFDQTRRKWLREWQPTAVFICDRWEVRVYKSPDFAKDLHSFMAEISPVAGRVIFVSQVPVIDYGDLFNLRELVSVSMGKQRPPPRLYPDSSEPLRKNATSIAEASVASFPNLRVLRVDRLFYENDGSVRYSSGRNFLYINADHLSDAGSETARGLFESAITEAYLTTPAKGK